MRSAEAAAGAWPQERESHGPRRWDDALRTRTVVELARLRGRDWRPRLLDVGGVHDGLLAAVLPYAAPIALTRDVAAAAAQPIRRARFLPGGMTALPFLSESFDVVTLLDLERLPAPAAVREARRVLKPGGHLVVSATRGDWTRRSPVRRFFRLFDDFTEVRIVGLVAWFPTIGWWLDAPLTAGLVRSRVRPCDPAEARTLVGAGVKR